MLANKFSKLSLLASIFVSGMSLTANAADCVLSSDIDFGGSRWELTAYNASSSMAGWNDYVTTVWVRDGYRITIFQDSNYNGKQYTLYGNGWTGTPKLGIHRWGTGVYYNLTDIGWNDTMSSFRCEVH